ncbi:MAG: hypothetical protein ACLUTA_00495 [Blautia wexlerae]
MAGTTAADGSGASARQEQRLHGTDQTASGSSSDGSSSSRYRRFFTVPRHRAVHQTLLPDYAADGSSDDGSYDYDDGSSNTDAMQTEHL